MARTFKLPDLGEGIHEAEIIEILVSVGEQVEEGDSILVAETDKAAVEIPSPFTAEITAIEVEVGDIVNTGDVMMSFSGEGEEGSEKVEAEGEEAPPAPEKVETREEPEMTPQEAPDRDGRPVPASPATRRLAREMGVNLRQVPPTGDAGRVTSQDVRAFAERPEGEQVSPPREDEERRVSLEGVPDFIPAGRVPSLPDFSRWGEVERVPLRSVRRATARQMALSWSQVPHVNHQDEVDITELETFRKEHKSSVEDMGGKLTPTVFAMKAAVAGLKKFPRFNASLDPESEEIILKNYYHIGIAMDTEKGLLVPVIRNVDEKSITDLSIELYELAQRTREGRAGLEELQGGTFSITNIGILGGTGFFPIVNFPEVAILGMGRAQWKPVIRVNKEGEKVTEPRFILPLMLAFDHRVVDGADAARFMNVVKEALQSPSSMLLTM